MDNSKKLSYLRFLVVALIVVFVIGMSLAFFYFNQDSSTQNFNTGHVELNFDDSTAIINTTGIMPLYEDEILTEATKKTFTISKPQSSKNIYVTLELTNISSSALKSYDMKWALYENNTKITTGNFGSLNTNSSIVLANNIEINTAEGRTFNLYLWIDETRGDQNYLKSENISLKINATGYAKNPRTLSSKIMSEFVNTNTIPNFSVNTIDRGVFLEQGSSKNTYFGFPTYYYRGSSTNTTINSIYEMKNYVTFAGILWRVMRINEDGTIRIITEDAPISLIDYGSVNYQNSNLKVELNNWYNTNIGETESDSYVMNGEFCNDLSGSMNRLTSYSIAPTFICQRDNVVISKVGTLTADDLLYAGAYYDNEVINNKTYLEKNNSYWTMTPSNDTELFIYNINQESGNKLIGNISNNTELSVAPVINLKPDILVVRGDGSINSPYVTQ